MALQTILLLGAVVGLSPGLAMLVRGFSPPGTISIDRVGQQVAENAHELRQAEGGGEGPKRLRALWNRFERTREIYAAFRNVPTVPAIFGSRSCGDNSYTP